MFSLKFLRPLQRILASRGHSLPFVLLAIVTVALAAATFIGQRWGFGVAARYVYHAWWCMLLWAVLAAVGLWQVCRVMGRRWHLAALHAALVLILAGAACTHFTGQSGRVHLRQGVAATGCPADEAATDSLVWPFSLTLERFDEVLYTGTNMPRDYRSHLLVRHPDGSPQRYCVSMNKVARIQGYTFCALSFDSDRKGSILLVRRDVWGEPLTYAGYTLLLLALLYMLCSPQGGFRRLLHARPHTRRISAAALLCMVCCTASAQQHAPLPTLSRPAADSLGLLCTEYAGRTCPLQTLASDFCLKVYGKSSYKTYTAEQVLAGWLFWPETWNNEPLIEVKSRALRRALHCRSHVSWNELFAAGYRLAPMLNQQRHHPLAAAAAQVHDRVAMVMSLRSGHMLRVFPAQSASTGHALWVSPVEPIDSLRLAPAIDSLRRHIFTDLCNEARAGQEANVLRAIGTLAAAQRTAGRELMPSALTWQAELAYNALPQAGALATALFFAVLLCAALRLWQAAALTEAVAQRRARLAWHATGGHMAGVCLLLTLVLVLRSVAAGRPPGTNGYETMLCAAWLTMACGLVLYLRRMLHPACPCLVAGLFLFTASLGAQGAEIGPLVPVLASPLLTLHVGIIITAYALLALTCACSAAALCMPRRRAVLQRKVMLLLYPAVALLAVGIFVGAVWAAQSWGRYWNWDAKEVWALITLFVYALPLHTSSLPWCRRPGAFHAYVTAAFLSVLMTYFGVNFFMSGLHSYA